ncbi:MAG: DUF3368 domain-containing protein, partial [Bacteroidota bacterium]
IALALEYEDSLLIIDERKGRNQAKEMGVRITGLLGIIIRAKKVGLITSGREKLETLLNQGFHVSPKLYDLVLREMKEN